MVVRYNKLKIFITAGEARPGGIIGAMLSPYLFSLNMSDFCKKFNDITKDYNSSVIFSVVIFSDLIEKTYTFYFNKFAFSLFLNNYFDVNFNESRRINLYYLYDLVFFYSKLYKLNLYLSALIILTLLKCYKKKYYFFNFSDLMQLKLKNLINNALEIK